MIWRLPLVVLLLALLVPPSACPVHDPPVQGDGPPVPVNPRVVDAASGTPIADAILTIGGREMRLEAAACECYNVIKGHFARLLQ